MAFGFAHWPKTLASLSPQSVKSGLLAAGGASVAALFVRRTLGAILHLVDELFVASVRERAAIAATEAEKARIARQIHDEPLQTLNGVIRRLEVQPVARADIEALVETAQSLRDVASELTPPVLHDLGLGPAIAHLADEMNLRSAIPIDLELDDASVRSARSRLPPDVEIALFRIVQEAVNNAEVHSGAARVRIGAEITPGAADIEVIDDGAGITEAQIRRAQWGGHLGVSGMRHRADSIGARLRIAERRPRGTRVAVSWNHR